MHYLIGDLQGCCDAFDRLLVEIGFSPSRDTIVVLGDLVNRGPKSLATLRRLRSLEGSVECLLGNHDLHLLAVASGLRGGGARDTLQDILNAPDREDWLAWLRQRRLALHQDGWLLVHAGVPPQWDVVTTLSLAAEVKPLPATVPAMVQLVSAARVKVTYTSTRDEAWMLADLKALYAGFLDPDAGPLTPARLS